MDDGLLGKAKRVCIYVNERDLHHHQPIHAAIIGLLRKEGAAGASVFRGIEGFGGSGVIHTSSLVDLGTRLPVLIEWIDRPDVVARLLPSIKGMVMRGLITVDDTTVELACVHPIRDISAAVHVADVMSREIVSVAPDAPVRKVVELMLGKAYRAIPVVDGGKPVGIITNTDLIRRGGLSMRMQLLNALDAAELHAELGRLADAKRAADVMSSGLVTIRAAAPLTEAAATMSFRRRKRLPVVNEEGRLVGMLSRLDVLRSAARVFPPQEGQSHEVGLAVDAPIKGVMRTDVPMVLPDSRLPEIVQAVASTRLNRCLVVDHERHPLGKITDAEVLERVTPSLRPSALRALIHRLPFAHPKPEELAAEQHATARTAADLMVPTASVAEDAPMRAAIAAMLGGEHKIIAVVDASGRLVGVLDRADLLHGLVAADETA